MLGVTLKLTSSLQCISKLQNVEQKYYGLREARKTDGDQIANAWLISPNNSSSFPESMLVSNRTFWCGKKQTIHQVSLKVCWSLIVLFGAERSCYNNVS